MFKKELSKRKKLLGDMIQKIERELVRLPQGNIRIAMKGKTAQYFLCEETGDTHGKYISVKEQDLIKKLVLRNYYEKMLRALKKEEKGIASYLSSIEGKQSEDIYASLGKPRQELISPLMLSKEMFAKRWAEANYEKNPYKADEAIYETKRGDYVRSKSEVIIADIYYELGIPYRYEAAVRLKNGMVKYPDFTALKVSTGKEYYHEHMGLMDDESYRLGNMRKLEEYMKSGIYTGDNLILTFESEENPINIPAIRKMIKEIFTSDAD